MLHFLFPFGMDIHSRNQSELAELDALLPRMTEIVTVLNALMCKMHWPSGLEDAYSAAFELRYELQAAEVKMDRLAGDEAWTPGEKIRLLEFNVAFLKAQSRWEEAINQAELFRLKDRSLARAVSAFKH